MSAAKHAPTFTGLTARQAARLKVGDTVNWQGSITDRGEVIETGYCAVKIKWTDGQVGIVHHNDFAYIGRAALKAAKAQL